MKHTKFWLFTTVAACALTCAMTCTIKHNVDEQEKNRLIDSVNNANELKQYQAKIDSLDFIRSERND